MTADGVERLRDEVMLELKEIKAETREGFRQIREELHGDGSKPGHTTRIALLEATQRQILQDRAEERARQARRDEETRKRFWSILAPLVVTAVSAVAVGIMLIYSASGKLS